MKLLVCISNLEWFEKKSWNRLCLTRDDLPCPFQKVVKTDCVLKDPGQYF